MKKEELRKLRRLYATDSMMEKAGMDVPKKTSCGYRSCDVDSYKYGIYMRCQILSGIMKVAFFLAESMRLGSNRPVYELFINMESGDFITWDVIREKWRNAKLDMLEWPEYTWRSGKFINREGNHSIITHLGVKNGGYRGLLDYQLNVRSEELKQKYRKETDPWDLVMEQIPNLPKDWEKWVDKVGITTNYIFYTYNKKGTTEGYCTYCGKMVPVSSPKHNKAGKCKCCAHDVLFRSIGKAARIYTPREHAYLIQKCEDGFLIREFKVYRYYEKEKYKTPSTSYHEERRTFYGESLFPSSYWYGDYKNMCTRWQKASSCSAGFGGEAGKVYGRTLPRLSAKELRRTGLPELVKGIDRIDPELYLANLQRKPYIEQLSKAGLTRFAYEVVKGRYNQEFKTNKSGELSKRIGIDKQRMKRMRLNNGGNLFLEWMQYEKIRNKCIPDEVIRFYENEGIYPKNIDFMLDRMSEIKISNYLKKQYRMSGRKSKELLSTWEDYLCMANRLKMDTKHEMIYKPKDLVKKHDETVKLCGGGEIAKRAGEIAEKFPDVDDICKSIKTKYEFADKNYAILVPDRIEDIIVEGRILGHCLDSSDIYFNRIQERESYIVFLRKQEDTEKPYYTLEIEPGGAARQKRTTGDKQNADFNEAKKFIEKWQIEIQKRLSEDDVRLAGVSAKLRVEEFNELRRTKAKIWHGHLAGYLLVDVLEADLMEVCAENQRCG